MKQINPAVLSRSENQLSEISKKCPSIFPPKLLGFNVVGAEKELSLQHSGRT